MSNRNSPYPNQANVSLSLNPRKYSGPHPHPPPPPQQQYPPQQYAQQQYSPQQYPQQQQHQQQHYHQQHHQQQHHQQQHHQQQHHQQQHHQQQHHQQQHYQQQHYQQQHYQQQHYQQQHYQQQHYQQHQNQRQQYQHQQSKRSNVIPPHQQNGPKRHPQSHYQYFGGSRQETTAGPGPDRQTAMKQDHYPRDPAPTSEAQYPPQSTLPSFDLLPESASRASSSHTGHSISIPPYASPTASLDYDHPGAPVGHVTQQTGQHHQDPSDQTEFAPLRRTQSFNQPNVSSRHETQKSEQGFNVEPLGESQGPSSNAGSAEDEKEKFRADVQAALDKIRELHAKDSETVLELWNIERSRQLQPIAKAHALNSSSAAPSSCTMTAARPSETKFPNSSQTTAPSSSNITAPRSPRTTARDSSTMTAPRSSMTTNPNSSTTPAPSYSNITAQSPSNATAASSSNITTPAPFQTATEPESPQKPQSPLPRSGRETHLRLVQGICKILRATPENHRMEIEASEIGSLLQKHSSYRSFCDCLEAKGFKINLHAFARALLVEVPEVAPSLTAAATAPPPYSSTSPQIAGRIEPNVAAKITHPSKTASVAKSSTVLTTRPASLGFGTTLYNQTNQRSSAIPMMPANINVEAASQQTVPPETRDSQVKPATATPVPDSESQMTPSGKSDSPNSLMEPLLERLNVLKEFVDTRPQPPISNIKAPLNSQPSRLDPSVPSRAPPSKEALSRKRNFNELIDLTQVSDAEEDNGTGETSSAYFPPAKRQETQKHELGQHRSPETFKTAKPAFSNTITPSVLGAPSFSAKANFSVGTAAPTGKTIESKPQQDSYSALPDHSHKGFTVVNQLDKHRAIRKSRYDILTIARDVLLATGRHPEMRSLNAHLEILMNNFKLGNLPDLSTFRWDLVDPGGPAPGSGAGISHQPEPVEIDIDDDDPNIATVQQPPVAIETLSAEQGTTAALRASGLRIWKAIEPKTVPAGPPEPKALPGGALTIPASCPSKTTPTLSHGGRPSARPSSQQQAAPETPVRGAISYGELRAQNVTDGQPRKRGRPVGWRQWMAQGHDSSSSKSTPSISVSKPAPKPVYQIYACKWRDCGAELHNLAKLRTHIQKLHIKPDEQKHYLCLWGECPQREEEDPQTGESMMRNQPKAHSSANRLTEHIERRHLAEIAWQLGDGPADGVAPRLDDLDLSEAYLSDSQGRRVTPVISIPQTSQAGASERGGGVTKPTPEERALAEQHRAEQKRRQIGPGIDKGGARLANPKRRQGLIEDDATVVIELD